MIRLFSLVLAAVLLSVALASIPKSFAIEGVWDMEEIGRAHV